MATTCTRPAALPTIPRQDCAVHLKQVQRFLMQRRQPVATPSFATEAAFKALASWEPLLEAADSTKVTLTPFVTSFTIPSSEAQFAEENSNGSLNGLGIYTGHNGVKPGGNFVGLDSALWEELTKLTDESLAELGVTRLTAYPVDAEGAVGHTANFGGIPIYNFVVGSPGSEGFRAQTLFPFSFGLPADWFKGVSFTKLSFNPLVDLDTV